MRAACSRCSGISWTTPSSSHRRTDGSVQDNGQGILPSFLPHVFEKFRQQDSSTTRAAFGLGLGLSIVKQIVELHGGSIHAMSAGEGLGATFVVRIPTNAAGAVRPAATGVTATIVS